MPAGEARNRARESHLGAIAIEPVGAQSSAPMQSHLEKFDAPQFPAARQVLGSG